MAYQKDISAILGISISTVSKALKGYPDISEETRQKVLKTAEDLEYRFQKRGGVNGAAHGSGAVGLVVPELGQMLESGYYRGMLLGMTQEAAKEKRDLVIMGAESASNGMSWGVRSIARRVDGLCIVAREEDFFRGRFAQILETNFPVVSIEHGPAGHIAVGSGRRQNIHMLLANRFFMDSTIGERAERLITGLFEMLSEKKEETPDEMRRHVQKEIREMFPVYIDSNEFTDADYDKFVHKLIVSIGEDFYRRQLLGMFEEYKRKTSGQREKEKQVLQILEKMKKDGNIQKEDLQQAMELLGG